MNIKTYKQRKERGFSVADISQELNDRADRYESVIVVALNEDKSIDVSYSSDSSGELVGLLEVAKAILIDEIRDS